ncbi:pantetheine-phosphate adenylyltransferase [Serpentinicella alkaliphila]|uniref:Phosphopantetheine adenylyltransferase n=1 Tax=Serpentinicella alkaliphila TaxID=1734049 RepID=A0A4R2TDY6_9FIRM|nr:pantetheine-phosphate adenylyltransferase [Serpentinicella alkaliphila]QUH26229.1 pantetheine-phosphate adenylyltransferase [Serpentinicella alkaliphila]TCQ01690.1 phosphopantetheine adenylyltransferase [Serpentinicella alkaliphila]
MGKAIYPGSFDPITNGHLDIIERAAKIFDEVIVVVLPNVSKNNLFTLEERVNLIKTVTKKFSNVSIDSYSGLLVDYANKNNITNIVKGLRAVSDFEYEFQMALMNKKLNPEVETVFLMTSNNNSYLSSSIVKEVVKYGGCISDLVPPEVEKEMIKRYT